MDHTVLHQKIIEAARREKPSEAVPYGFQTRVMAQIRSLPAADPWLAWSNALWRAAAPCAAIALLLGAWTLFEPESNAGNEFAQHFENTVLAGMSDDPALE